MLSGMDNTDETATHSTSPARKRWFRFSISTLLLVSVIVALAISHWTSARDRLALQRKLDQIRRDHDLLEITDPDKIFDHNRRCLSHLDRTFTQ